MPITTHPSIYVLLRVRRQRVRANPISRQIATEIEPVKLTGSGKIPIVQSGAGDPHFCITH
ncbi:hypothetical protein A8H37_25770 [Burkholderia thailandensis]|nr:hypothetical protein [Burkholderia thailandensis]PNE76693.1 hypothetical protein A8H37_25770 [Burkholderia thailandensis]